MYQDFDVRPAQLSPRCGDNFFRGNGFGKTRYVVQVFRGEAVPVVGFQLSRQCRDNLLTVGGAFVAQRFGANAVADEPVNLHQRAVAEVLWFVFFPPLLIRAFEAGLQPS